MNYLTNYYKNLSEQLQQKVYVLEQMLNESGNPTPEPPWPTSPMPQSPDTAPAPATSPAQPTTPPPPRPDPRGYPNGSQDPGYQKEWYEYFKWWQQQPAEWKAKNPLPPQPMKPGSPGRPRPGGGYYPGTGPRPVR